MREFILVIHLLIALAMIVVIMLQRSEGGALGIGGGGGGLMSGRSAANLLTRTTGILAACFFVTSLALAILGHGSQTPGSILDVPAQGTVGAPATSAPAPVNGAPAAVPPAVPAAPAEPSVPLSK